LSRAIMAPQVSLMSDNYNSRSTTIIIPDLGRGG
jgi:hypothetical protein